MNVEGLLHKAINKEFLTKEEGLYLYQHAPLSTLITVADQIRKELHPKPYVTWIIDRNVNYSNICYAGCKFCNFYAKKNSPDAYVTTMEQYRFKINEMYALGGRQLLLQGGLHPDFGLKFYMDLFSSLKREYPDLKLHALGPAEIVDICKKENISYLVALKQLQVSGLDSLPGAGAEILVDRVRLQLSKVKCSANEWLDVMHAAHTINMVTSATMMFGHIETMEERIEHLVRIRDTQANKPDGAVGFISFILWPFQSEGTVLERKYNVTNKTTMDEYIRMVCMSRILLPNIKNIQASILTVGKPTAQVCLHAGANDLGSIMIEENVVSAAGGGYQLDATMLQNTITEAGYIPMLRDQQFNHLSN